MSNPRLDYNNAIRAALPSGLTYSNNRYLVNNKPFVSFKNANWYKQYIEKFGYDAGGGGGGGLTNFVAPSISGAAVVGEVLTGDHGMWFGPLIGYSYRWLRDGVAISGATAVTYTVVADDVGTTPTFEVTAISPTGSATATSTGVSASAVVIPSAITAPFGAKTLAGAGAYRPTDNAGNALALASYNSLVSGSLGAYTASISSGGLRFTGGGAGAPAGAVLRCTYAAGGTVDITIAALEANTYSVSTIAEASSAYAAATITIGDTIRLRAGEINPTALRQIIQRTSVPPGTWTGTSALDDGNWITVTRDIGAKVRIGAVEINGGGATFARYLRLHDLDIISPFQADGNGVGTGTSAAVGGQVTVGGNGSHVAITNCRFSHTAPVTGATVGAFRAISQASLTWGQMWIEGNTINGARHGIITAECAGSVIRGNTIKRVLSDGMNIGRCTGTLIEGNVITEKVYGYDAQAAVAVTRGASTVVEVSSTSLAVVGEPMVFSGFSGDFGAAVNNTYNSITAKTATTLTIALDTSSLPDWDGVAGTVQASAGLHGDYIQFNENLGATAYQDNVTLRGNILYRGFVGGEQFVDGQGLYAGLSGTTAIRTGWLIEGNIYCGLASRGISIGKTAGAVIRSNTVTRVLGIDASVGGSTPSILTDANCTGTTIVDNIAHGYTLLGTITENDNNETVTISSTDAVPADPANVTAYQAAFVSPVTVPNVDFAPAKAFETREDAGGQFAGFPIFPGATPYFDFNTLVYSDPRA